MSNLSSLEESLLSAKKFMDHDRMSVGESSTQQYSREQEPPMELLSSLPPGQAPASAAPRQENMQPHSALTPERINSSGLPSAIKEAMISVSSSEYHMFSVPLEVSINSGDNWGEAH